jgi:hypothetical protein
MSNVSNATVDDRFFEKHQYHSPAPDRKNMLRLKRLKHGHVGKVHSGNDNGTGKNSGKVPMLKSRTRSIAALTKKIDKFILPDDEDDEDEASEEEEVTSNCSNAAFTHKASRRSVVETERQTFRILKCARDMFAMWKKETGHTLIHMQIFVFVEKRF